MAAVAGLEEMVASDGLAPARCGGLLTSLSASRPAALGAGQASASAAAKRSFAAAVRGRHAVCGRASDCDGGHELATWSGTDGQGIALRTLDSGSVATTLKAACPRAAWQSTRGLPRVAGLRDYEEVRKEVCDTFGGVEKAVRRLMAEAKSKYALVYDVVRLAPNFGRSRGRLRGAAGSSLLLGAGRTRMSLVEAKIALVSARCAWRSSERVLEGLMTECARIERGVQVIRSTHVQLVGARRWDTRERAHGRGMSGRKEQVCDVHRALLA